MGLFDKVKGPVFLKDDSDAVRQLESLQKLRENASNDLGEELDQEIRRVNAGIYGEDRIRFELQNSHIPMFILHDLYLEHDGLSAQIDYLLVTRRHLFVLECKNLYGDIEINSAGDFVRTVNFGRRMLREGVYSPITQNRRHLELLKQIRAASKGNLLTRALFERSFYDNYRSVVVLANPKTVLNARYAKKEVRDQVIRADQLVEYIRRSDAEPKAGTVSEKEMEETARFFLSCHKPCETDYTAKFRELLTEKPPDAPAPPPPPAAQEPEAEQVLCPKCGCAMVRRKAAKGANAGKEFWGCPNFPKCRETLALRQEETCEE